MALTPLRVDGRDELVRAALTDEGCDFMVVTTLNNIRWLTGFTGSNATARVGPDETIVVTDNRYATDAPRQLEAAGSEARVAVSSDLVAAAVEELDPTAIVGLEDSVTWAAQRQWAEAHPGELRPLSELIEQLRSVKTPAEIERMEAAAAVVDEALSEARSLLVPGTTERTLALALDDAMRARGAEGPAYETIVASGPNAALPHARPTDRPFSDGDLVIVDAGALVDGYRSDMTRTFVIGTPSDRAHEMLDVVTRSQAAGVREVAPGVEAGAVDRICREVIEDAGMGEAFVHGAGHGVGLDVHELPRVRKGSTAILCPGHALTVEPGVYYPGVGGVRIEDTLVVTDDGCRPITRFPKDPIVI